MAKYLVVGAGGVGGTLASCLALGGCSVDCIARGAQLDAIRKDGIRFHSDRMGKHTLRVEAFTAEEYDRIIGGEDADELRDALEALGL